MVSVWAAGGGTEGLSGPVLIVWCSWEAVNSHVNS